VLPIGGVTAKIEAAAEAGMTTVLIPKKNENDVLIEDRYKDKIKIIPVETLTDVLENALVGPGKEDLLKKLRLMKPPKITGKVELESERKATPLAKIEDRQKPIPEIKYKVTKQTDDPIS
jgi:hypothetical protein